MKVNDNVVGVCSWSLKPVDTADLINSLRQVGLSHVQLALAPLLALDEDARAAAIVSLRDAGIELTATMIGFPGEDYSSIAIIRRTGGLVPDDQWPTRREIALKAGKLTGELKQKLLTFHIGFVPTSNDPAYKTMIERVQELATEYARDDVSLLMETGQESASELLRFLNDLNCRNVGVNFDPANMILYGAGDPIEAIGLLGRHIKHVHIKDAIASEQPGVQWGREVPFGAGEVVPELFLDALAEIDYSGALVIEREAGPNRIADVRAAVAALQSAE